MKKFSKKFAVAWAAAVTIMVVAMMAQIMRPGNAMGAQEQQTTGAGDMAAQGDGMLHAKVEFEDIRDMLRQRCVGVLENGVTVEDAVVLSDVFGDSQIKQMADALAAELEKQGQEVPAGFFDIIKNSRVPAKWRLVLDGSDVERIADIMMAYIEENKSRLYDGDRLSDAGISALVREALDNAMADQEGRLIVSKEYISGSSDIIREVISNITGSARYHVSLSDEDIQRIIEELKPQIQMPPAQKQILGREELNTLISGWQEQLTKSFTSMIDYCNSKMDGLSSDIDYLGRRVDNDMTSLKSDVESGISSAENRMGQSITEAENRMGDGITSAESRMGQSITEAESRLGGDITSLSDNVKDNINSFREDVNADISAVSQNIEGLSQHQEDTDIRLGLIRKDNEESIAALKESTQRLIDALASEHGAMIEQNTQAAETLRAMCEALEADKVSKTEFAEFGEAVNAIIEKATEENNNSIAQLAAALKKQEEAVSRINDLYSGLDKSVTARFEKVREEAQKRQEEIYSNMNQSVEDAKADMQENIDRMADSVDKKLDKVSAEAQSQIDRQNKELGQRMDAIIAELDKSSSESDKKLAQLMKDMQQNIGDTSKLVTSQKNVVGAINEVFQFASDGKRLIADAITAPSAGTGVKTEADASFAVMAGNISRLAAINYNKGRADADSAIDPSSSNYKAGAESAKKGSAVASQVLEGVTFTSQNGINQTGTMADRGMLNWKPSAGEVLRIPEGYYKGGLIDSSAAYEAGVKAGLTAEKKQSFLKYTIDNVCSTPYKEDSNDITYNVDGFSKIYYRFSSSYGENEDDESFGKASLTINNQRLCMFDEYDDDDNRIYGGRTYDGVFDCSGLSTITTSVWIYSGSSRWGVASFQITDVE